MHIIVTDDEQSALNVLTGAVREAVPLATVYGFRNPLEALEFMKEKNARLFFGYTDAGKGWYRTCEEIKRNISKGKLYDTGATAEYGDEFITLSCCAYHVEDGRFVVVGKRIYN